MKQSNFQDFELQRALRDACIQRFEYSIELSWKVSMKILGSSTVAAKPAIREMARNSLISNSGLWLDFIESRNETSHAYDEDIATKVFLTVQKFIPEAEKLICSLEQIK
ncbi:MAG: nucleotidyltransferase substrate binding protein [Bdellovibrionales bacterium]|nr:nucleotidyltransferase substrate binding protein [Bdellovibrionales bacterium]